MRLALDALIDLAILKTLLPVLVDPVWNLVRVPAIKTKPSMSYYGAYEF